MGIVTNMDWYGEELIHRYHKKCGKSEEADSVMRDDLAGGENAFSGFCFQCRLLVGHDIGI
jgi:hypothetical protein